MVLDQQCGGYARFKLPSTFQETPKSHAGENKWIADFFDPTRKISISMGSFGRISDLELVETVPRFTGMSYGQIRDTIEDEGKTWEEVIAAEAEAKSSKDYFLLGIIPQRN